MAVLVSATGIAMKTPAGPICSVFAKKNANGIFRKGKWKLQKI